MSIAGGPLDNPVALPDGLMFQRRTPDFTADTLPAALRGDHNTKPGTWGLIHVTEGSLRYEITDERRAARSITLTPDDSPGIVEPTILHHVTPLGPVRFHVAFLRAPDAINPQGEDS